MRKKHLHSTHDIKRGRWLRAIALGIGILLPCALQVANAAPITSASIYSIVKTSAGLFAGTGGDGVFGSTDGGLTWTAANTGLTDNAVSQLIASANGTLFVSTGAGLARSTDNAQNWVALDTSTDKPLGLKFFTVNSAGSLFAVGTSGLYKSTDDGTTWTLVSPGFGTMSIDPVTYTLSGYTPFVYAGPAGSLYTTGWGGGFYRSTDGATWAEVDTTMKSGTLVAVTAGAGTEAFAATSDKAGVYRSIDNGVTWKKIFVGLLATKVYNIACNSAGDALAATDDGVYRFVKNGDEWRKTNTLLADTVVYAVAVTTGYVLAGTLSTGEIFRMVDAFNPPADPAPVRFDSLPGYTFLTTFKIPSGPFLLGTNRGAFRSADTGKTWYRIPNGMGGDTTMVTAFAYSGTRLYAVAYGSLYRSADNGNRWVSLQRSPDAQGIAGGTGGRIVTSSATSEGFAYSDDNGITWVKTYSESLNKTFASNSSGTMYALGSSVYRSTNNGSSWTQTCTNPFSDYVFAGQIVSGGAIVVSTGSGIYWSADNGATFALRASGLVGYTGTNIAVNANSDVFTLVGGALYRMSSGDTAWKQMNQGPFSFLAQSEDGVVYTVDRAGKFALAASVSPHQGNWYLCDALASIRTWGMAVSSGGTVFAATDSGLYKSTDKGATWSHITVLSAHPTWIVDDVIVLPTGTVLVNYSSLVSVGGDYGVYRSTDNGATWTKVSGANAYLVSEFVLGASGTVYAVGLLGSALYRSADDGATWILTEPAKNGYAATMSSNFAATSNGMYFASDSGIYRSTNNGGSWARVSTFTNQAILSTTIKSGVVISGNPSATALFACADSGIFRSIDNGATWQNINRALVNMSTMFISPQGYLFVGKWGLANQDSSVGLFYSADQGATWLCLTKGLDDRSVETAACGPQGEVYATFGNPAGATAYRYTGTLVPMGIKTPGLKMAHVMRTGAYPNPFGAITWISYSIVDKSDLVSLSICNTAGQVVKQLVDCRQAAGEYRVAWDGRNDRGAPATSGTYIYRLGRNGEMSYGKLILTR
jgi:photosystem II stability/assembly factor-like uncharacterized protein